MRGDKIKIAKKTADIGARIHNRFDVEVINSATGEIRQRAQAENVVLDQLWGVLCSNAGSPWNGQIQYGTGSGTPSSSDSSLFSYLGFIQTRDDTVHSDWENQVYSVTSKYVMDELTAVGQTLTEIGIAQKTNGAVAGTLMTHAMFKDMNGNPISIEKTDGDILNIYSTVYVHLNLPEWVNCYGHIGSSDKKTAIRHFLGMIPWKYDQDFIAAYSNGYRIGTFGNSPVESYGHNVHPTMHYYPAERKVTLTFPRIPADELNSLGYIREVFLCGCHNSSGNAYTSYDPDFGFVVDDSWCEKSRITNEIIGTGDGSTEEFKTKFKTSGNVVIKVDGQQVSATTVNEYIGSNFKNYFKLVKGNRSLNGNHSWNAWEWPGRNVSEEDACVFENVLAQSSVSEGMISRSTGVSSIFGSSYAGQSWALCSDDLINWTRVEGSETIPTLNRYSRYWQFFTSYQPPLNGGANILSPVPFGSLPSENNVLLEDIPPEGSVITADYDTDTIAKDEYHVFDLSITFTFGEYTEAT